MQTHIYADIIMCNVFDVLGSVQAANFIFNRGEKDERGAAQRKALYKMF